MPPSPVRFQDSAGASARLADAHRRFARGVLAIYMGAAAIAIGLLFTDALTDRRHESHQIAESLALQNQVRATWVAQHLALLASEIDRLSRRNEINPDDTTLEPERSLLELSHHESAFFNAGVAVVGRAGAVLWSEPPAFLPAGQSVASEHWFADALAGSNGVIVPIHPEIPGSALVYVVSRVEREGHASGAIVGGLDLEREGTMRLDYAPGTVDTLITTLDGTVVFPSRDPRMASSAEWHDLFASSAGRPFVIDGAFSGERRLLVGAPIPGAPLLLIGSADPRTIYAPAESRFARQMVAGVALAVLPLGLLIVILQRSLRIFARSEADAAREDRLKMVGEAANLIAHEVKNSLNNLRVGVDVVTRRNEKNGTTDGTRVFDELKREIERLSSFSAELMSFSKGINPRAAQVDLAAFVPEVALLAKDAASESGASIDVVPSEHSVLAIADASLVHVAVGNMVSNAVDAAAARPGGGGRVTVLVGSIGERARVRVVDNGAGVPESIRAHLFEPFVTGKPSGVGIGLALSRKIALAHGGDLVLDEVPPGGGASFSLFLPLSNGIAKQELT